MDEASCMGFATIAVVIMIVSLLGIGPSRHRLALSSSSASDNELADVVAVQSERTGTQTIRPG